jgi:hypothetical protein
MTATEKPAQPASSPIPGTPRPTVTPEPGPDDVPPSIACPDLLCAWSLEGGEARPINLENLVEITYDYAPATRRVLHGKFTRRGAGPGNVAVTNLQALEIDTGQSVTILASENVVEAAWAPNGKDLAYILANRDTYELHWRSETGEDRSLAREVAFTFSVSPAGDQIAFTRESGYGMGGEPGLYVVSIETGEERQLSAADRAGAGALSERPIWSPDGSQVILPIPQEGAATRWLRASADGNGASFLIFTPHFQQALSRRALEANLLWHPNLIYLVAQAVPLPLSGLPSEILLLELDPALEQVLGAEVIHTGEGELLGWDVPGWTIWFRPLEDEPQRINLP